jgi:hypothetical protein
MHRWLRLVFSLIALYVAASSLSARAHPFKLDAVINTFVTIERGEAHFVVRAPLYLFQSARFPVNNNEIDIPQSGPAMERALGAIQKDIVIFVDGRKLIASSATGRLSSPSDRSFQSYDKALRHVSEPVLSEMRIYVDEGYVDAHITYPLQVPNPEMSIRTTAGPQFGDELKLIVRYTLLDGESRALIMTASSGTVVLNPTWWRAAGGFVGLGMDHILTGIDHLLFLFCLVIPVRRVLGLLSVITAFTIAHSITLFASAFHLVPQGAWFPPFVEMAIAVTIVYTALENIVGAKLRHRWLLAGGFGLVHGFGFSNALGESLQFAGSHLLLSLFSFNVGIELGQLGVLALMLPALVLFRRLVPVRPGIIILSSIAALIGSYWIVERWQVLNQALQWPRLDPDAIGSAARWGAMVLIVFAAGWILFKWTAHKSQPGESSRKRQA